MSAGVFDIDAVYLCTVPSGKAVIVQVEDEELCIPKSQICSGSDIFAGCDLERGTEARLLITEWIARKKSLL